MLRETDRQGFLKALKEGDIGLTKGRSFFAKVQFWLNSKTDKAADKASHGIYIKESPLISEADGKYVSENTIERYLTDHHKVWVFRNKNLTKEALDEMRHYVAGAEESGGIYSWGGILQFAKKLFHKTMKDKRGVFCTEYTSRIIGAGNLTPYIIDKMPHEISPSVQLTWFLEAGVQSKMWGLVAYWDNGKSYVEDLPKQA